MSDNQKEKVLFLYNGAFALANFKSELIYKFINKGHEVFLLVPDGKELKPLIEHGCNHIHLDLDRRDLGFRKNIKLMYDIWKVIKKVRPTKVISYTIKCNVFGGIVCRQTKTPYYANITGLGSMFHSGTIREKFFLMMYRFSLKEAERVFFQNKENMNYLLENNIVNKKQCILTYGSGVNLDKFVKTDYTEDEELSFLFSGRIMKDKGIDELLEAIKIIKPRYNHVQFYLAGFYEEDYSEKLKYMEKNNLLKYCGFQEDIRPLIAKSNCVILPSYHEGMSNILLEAGAMGRPSIASDIPGCKEIITDGYSGYLVKPHSTEALVEKIELFISLTPFKRAEMAENAYQDVVTHFDRNEVNELIYTNVFNRK